MNNYIDSDLNKEKRNKELRAGQTGLGTCRAWINE
jgi:hypothetical protein